MTKTYVGEADAQTDSQGEQCQEHKHSGENESLAQVPLRGLQLSVREGKAGLDISKLGIFPTV